MAVSKGVSLPGFLRVVAGIVALVLTFAAVPVKALGDQKSRTVIFSGSSVSSYAGLTLFETAVSQSSAAFPNGSATAILVGEGGWPDALPATSLAGLLDCPILFSQSSQLPNCTASELNRLGVSNVIVVGGQNVVSDPVLAQLDEIGVSWSRIWGQTAFDTQMAVFNEWFDQWDADLAIVATGTDFADALSASPIAFAKKAPIFLVDSTHNLSDEQKVALSRLAAKGELRDVLLIGGHNVISGLTKGFLDGISTYVGGSLVHLWGNTLFDTSAAVASWSVTSHILSWDNVAFASGGSPYDALSGAVLQAKTGAALLLVGDDRSSTIEVAKANKNCIRQIRFFGGTSVISERLRMHIGYQLGLPISYVDLSMMCMMQYPELPTGCEAVALSNALTYYGFSLSKYEIVDRWLPRSGWDWVTAYQGNPYSWGGGAWNSCCAPALCIAANNYLGAHGSSLRAYNITGTSFSNLYDYIAQGYPVIVWNTVDMGLPGLSTETRWHDGTPYRLYGGTHTVVLKGFDKNNGTVLVADSISGYVSRDAGSFGWIYSVLGSQAVVIM